MQRRKFIAGLGSLAAGSAAAMGTGAVSSQDSPRLVDTDVTMDANGTLGIITSDESLENAQFAATEKGQLVLRFDGTDSTDLWASSAEGLNPDTTYHFDNVFQLLNRTSDTLRVEFDKSNLDNPGAFNFYGLWTNGELIGSRDSDYTGNLSSGAGLNVGVTIRTPDSVPEAWETGSVVIHADDPNDQNID